MNVINDMIVIIALGYGRFWVIVFLSGKPRSLLGSLQPRLEAVCTCSVYLEMIDMRQHALHIISWSLICGVGACFVVYHPLTEIILTRD